MHLLEDLMEETSASNRRVADRLDEETRNLDQQRQVADVRQSVVEAARQATRYTIARLPQAEGVWGSAITVLAKKPLGEDAERLLRGLLEVFESGQRLVQAPRRLWELAIRVGAQPEAIDELEKVEKRFKELAEEVHGALEHRSRDWKPRDPERFAAGLQAAREGKAIKAEEARARFR
jgi:hypothetical protein